MRYNFIQSFRHDKSNTIIGTKFFPLDYIHSYIKSAPKISEIIKIIKENYLLQIVSIEVVNQVCWLRTNINYQNVLKI